MVEPAHFYTEFMPRRLTRSRALQQRAEKLLPGGVDSPVRAFRAVGGQPPFVDRGEGAHLWDVDGNGYIDYFGSWGPMILGHAFPDAVEAMQQAAEHGTSFGAPTAAEGDLAELVVQAFPSVEKLRLSVRGRKRRCRRSGWRGLHRAQILIKFEGCYHGHVDSLLVKAGSGVATFGIPGTAGVPAEIAHLRSRCRSTMSARWRRRFAANPGEIACMIVEPVLGNAGCIPPEAGYLELLREITAREGALLIFDEVMTGFRLALGGAQELYGITPDMTTLGKIIGGGLPWAAFGGRAEIMDLLAPLGPVYQAGTLSGNPLAMAAGIATVGHLIEHRDSVYPLLERLSEAVAEVAARRRRPVWR